MKPKLLLLDDSKLLLSTLKNSADKSGIYKAYTANTFHDAKILIDMNKFDAAILDLELPDAVDGEQVDYVLEHHIPVIIISGTYNDNLKKIVSEKAIIDYIVKGSFENIHLAVQMAENILLYKNKRVLIVDDSRLSRMQLRVHFEHLGFITQETDSAQGALKIIKEQSPFDLITVDYEMPEKNGVEFILEARRIKNDYPTVFFGVTGSDSSEVSIRFLKSGANDSFVKPLQKELFNIKIANAFGLINKQNELNQSKHVFGEYVKALDNATIMTKGDTYGRITYVSKAFCELTANLPTKNTQKTP